MNQSLRKWEVQKGKKRSASERSAAGQAIVQGIGILSLIVSIVVGIILLITDISLTMSYQQKVTFLAQQAAIYYAGQANGWQYQNSGGFAGNTAVTAALANLSAALASLAADRKSGASSATIANDQKAVSTDRQAVSAAANNLLQAFVQSEAVNMGIPSTGSSSITVVTAPQPDSTTNITVSASNLPLIPGLSILPGVIPTVQQTFNSNANLVPRPTGLLSITVAGQTYANQAQTVVGNTVMVPCYSGEAQGDAVATRAAGDEWDPVIPGPGSYDQFSFSITQSSGSALGYKQGARGMTP